MMDLLTMDLIDLMHYCRKTSPTYEECSRKFDEVLKVRIEKKTVKRKSEIEERFRNLTYVYHNKGMHDLYSLYPDFDPIKLEEYKRRGGVR